MAGRLAFLRNALAPPVFESRRKTEGAASNTVIAAGLLVVLTPLLVLLLVAFPAIQPVGWTIIAGMDIIAVASLVLTRLGFVESAAALMLVAFWALYTWVAWVTDGLFSAAVSAQFLVMALAQANRGPILGAVAAVLSVGTVSFLTWAEISGLTPESVTPVSPLVYGVSIAAFLIALAVMHGLVRAREHATRARVADELAETAVAQQRLGVLVDHAPFGAFVCDLEDERLVVSRSNLHASVALGEDATVFVGADLSTALPLPAGNDIFERLRSLAETGEEFDPVEVCVRVAAGERTLDIHAYQAEPTVIAVFFSDVTKQRLAEAKIREMAYHDSLTTLPNRLLLLDRLGIALATSKRRDTGVALLFVDLDNFKVLNDRYGHAFGDMVLASVGMRLLETARASDTVARIGGDEFIVLMPDADDRSQAETVAMKIIRALRDPLIVDGRPVVVTASIGVTVSTEHDVEAKELLALADHAMYEVKREGRDGYRMA